MTNEQEESLRRILFRMRDIGFARKEVIEFLKETGTPKVSDVVCLVDEYFPEADW